MSALFSKGAGPRRLGACKNPLGAVLTAVILCLAPADARAQIKLTPPAVDFGERGHNERPTQEVTVENLGKSPLVVREMKRSCDCIELTPRALSGPIPAGGSASIKVSMGSGLAMGKLDKYVGFFCGDDKVPAAVLPVKMRVFEGFSRDPWDFRFDGVVGGEPVVQHVDLKSRSGQKTFTLTVDGVKEARGAAKMSDHFSAKVVDIPGGKRIELTLKPTYPEGRIWANLEGKLEGKTLVVPVAGEMFRWIKVVPTYFNFSRVSSEDPSSFSKEVTLTSTDKRSFKVVSMTPAFHGADKPNFSLQLALRGTRAEEAAAQHVIQARVEPTGGGPPRGSFSGKVTVRTDHPEKPEIILSFFGFFPEPRK
jgi:hypothetical protein